MGLFQIMCGATGHNWYEIERVQKPNGDIVILEECRTCCKQRKTVL